MNTTLGKAGASCLMLLLALAGSRTALGDERPVSCRDSGALDGSPPVVELRVDNDLFADQDQGYTSGVALSLISPNLANYRHDQCLPAPARWLNRYLELLQPHGFDQQNMVVRLDHRLYTPTDPKPTELIESDRPYAGVFTVSRTPGSGITCAQFVHAGHGVAVDPPEGSRIYPRHHWH